MDIRKHNYDWLIIGGGLFGCVFAHEMTKAGKKVAIVERRDKIGGNIRCDKSNGVVVHCYGAHIFHTNKREIWDYVNKVTPLRHVTHSPMAKTPTGKILSLPFGMHTFNGLWPEITTPVQAKEKINSQTARWRDKYPVPQNLKEKSLCLVGEDIFEELIRHYTEKQWNTACENLPPEIITRIPLRFTWDLSYFDDAFVGIPENGYNPFIEKIVEGVDILTGIDYNKNREDFKGIAANILYTGCIDEFYGYSLGRLGYRSLRFEMKFEALENSQGCSVVNYTGPEAPYTRCIEHNYFAPNNYYEELVKSYEYPADFKEGAEPYYPIINQENKRLYSMYSELAKATPNIHFGGRLGLFQYMDMDDAIEAALKMANRILLDESLTR